MATIEAVPRRPHVALTLRLPPELHARLVAIAEQEDRSLSAEVIHLLRVAAERIERERQQRKQGRPDGDR